VNVAQKCIEALTQLQHDLLNQIAQGEFILKTNAEFDKMKNCIQEAVEIKQKAVFHLDAAKSVKTKLQKFIDSF